MGGPPASRPAAAAAARPLPRAPGRGGPGGREAARRVPSPGPAVRPRGSRSCPHAGLSSSVPLTPASERAAFPCAAGSVNEANVSTTGRRPRGGRGPLPPATSARGRPSRGLAARPARAAAPAPPAPPEAGSAPLGPRRAAPGALCRRSGPDRQESPGGGQRGGGEWEGRGGPGPGSTRSRLHPDLSGSADPGRGRARPEPPRPRAQSPAMRPPPPWLLLLLLHLGAAAPTAGPFQDPPSQLPAPQNPRIHLYNAEQVLSWEPVSLSGGEGPAVYRVQFKYATSSDWFDLAPPNSHKANCSRIAARECNFAPALFDPLHNISLRVRAELPERASAWAAAPWFQRYLNVTVGPPENIRVTPGPGSLTLSFSPPFDVEPATTHFSYCVRYWTLENAGDPQDNGCLRNPLIELKDLKPLRVYCLQVRATLVWNSNKMSTEGLFSNVSCHETAADASTKLQEVVLIALGTFLSLTALAGACVFLTLRYRGLIKHWLHTPPGVPVQIGEYLRDPEDPVLEAMDQDSTPKEDAWDSVSVLSAPEEQKMLQSTRDQGPGSPQPAGADSEL